MSESAAAQVFDELADEVGDSSLGQATLEFIVRNCTKERESSDYIKSWANATRGDSALFKESPNDGDPCLSQLKFEIVSARTVDIENAKKYVAYTIMIRRLTDVTDPHPAVIERRYSDFLLLYNSLKKEFPEVLSYIQFPKKALTGNFSPETISARSASFEAFLTSVTDETQLKDCLAFTSFLQRREILESLRLIQDEQYDQARPLVENSFRLMNKVQTDRSPIVLRYLCLLVALHHTCSGSSGVESGRAVALAALAIRRYQCVSDTDLLRYYVPLLRTTLDLCHAAGKDTSDIFTHLADLRRKGINIDPPVSLFHLVLQDLYPMLEGECV